MRHELRSADEQIIIGEVVQAQALESEGLYGRRSHRTSEVVEVRANKLSHIKALLCALSINGNIKIHEIVPAHRRLRRTRIEVGNRHHDRWQSLSCFH